MPIRPELRHFYRGAAPCSACGSPIDPRHRRRSCAATLALHASMSAQAGTRCRWINGGGFVKDAVITITDLTALRVRKRPW